MLDNRDKTGKWEVVERSNGRVEIYCSVCKMWSDTTRYWYCPCCGAQMENGLSVEILPYEPTFEEDEPIFEGESLRRCSFHDNQLNKQKGERKNEII